MASKFLIDQAIADANNYGLQVGTPFNNPVGGVDQFATEMEALEAARAGDTVSVNELGGTLEDFYTNRNLTGAATQGKPTDANTRFKVIDDDINFNNATVQPQGIVDVNHVKNLIANAQRQNALNNWTSIYGNPELYQGFVERGEPLAVSSTPSKWEQITGMVGDVWQGAKDQLGSGWETLKTKAQIPLGIMGAVANRYNALNPNAVNYNPALAGQIDFMKDNPFGTGSAYGTDWDQSGLNKITSGRLAGKNLQSFLGSNDLMEMYEKDLARLEKTLANLPKQWSNLMKNNPTAYANKVKTFQDRIAQNKWEQEQARKDLEQRNRIRLGSHLVQDRNYRSDPELSRIGREKYTGQGQAFQQRKGTTTKRGGQTFHYGGRKDGGRIGYANGGLASLFTRRG
jgi:hypothetical protein